MAGQGNLRLQLSYALNSALLNPYHTTQNPVYASYSGHYSSSASLSATSQATTSQGYALSSTYTPSQVTRDSEAFSSQSISVNNGQRRSNNFDSRVGKRQGHWYEPGNHKCAYKQCNFSGSRNALEIHMMDRHLIYPSNWSLRRQPRTWDADPDLNTGKPFMILGTDIVLNTPETVDMWIAERKKRWPSSARVEEKKQKLAEAVTHGHLSLQRDQSQRKRKVNVMDENDRRNVFDRPKNRIRTVASKECSTSNNDANGSFDSILAAQTSKAPHPFPISAVDTKISDSESDSGSNMDSEKDALSSRVHFNEKHPSFAVEESLDLKDMDVIDVFEKEKTVAKATKSMRRIPQPGKSIYNPFENRNNLLYNLLNPEIRLTVSNFSMAIRFLVENECLHGVEIKPGDAETHHVEIIDDYSQEHHVPDLRI